MKNLIWFLMVLLLLIIAAIMSTLLFLGVGYVLTIILPLSLFESAVLVIGSFFVLVFSIAAVSIGTQISRHGFFFPRSSLQEEPYDDDECDFDEDEEEEDYYERDNVLKPHQFIKNTVKIGRNTPCPCGSGLKYKRCCGKDK